MNAFDAEIPANRRDRLWARSATAALLALVVLVGFGCATAKVIPFNRTSENTIARPSVVLVYDFATIPSDVVVDSFGSEFAKELTEEEQRAHATAGLLSEKLVEHLTKRGVHAERATSATRPPLNALLIKGRFVTVDEGSAIKRMVIGFGSGSSELRIMVQVYQATERGLRRIVEAEAEATGSKMPGMAVPLAGGAAMGSVATSAMISGGMALTRETKAALAPDMARIAKKIAERAEAFYKRRGWL
jgi:hypothetical protein